VGRHPRFAKLHATDGNQAVLTAYMQSRGALVKDIGRPVDLLVGYKGHWIPVEVKLPRGKRGGARGSKLSERQQEFFSDCAANRLPARVIRTVEEAAALLDCFLDIVACGSEEWPGSCSCGKTGGGDSGGGSGV
jgi:hypothetical protein